VRCLQGVLDDCLVLYQEPSEFWRSVRTTNPIERAFREVRRRTKVMDNVLLDEAAVLRIFAAVAQDMNRTWGGRPSTDFNNFRGLTERKRTAYSPSYEVALICIISVVMRNTLDM